jgi:alkanesulfonate monooxygenase SsuD/methylene tetrahydromethanopterin reductase-like flavin-dependent oxidoreductase (luciferase family)
MKLGVYLNSQHRERDDPKRRLAEMLEQVREIRALGFDSIWAGEHHLVPGFHYFPQLPLLARIAAEAEGAWLGTHVTLLPLHNPVELAEIGAFLDLVSGGKFLLGVGLGYREEEFAAFGVAMSERVSRLTEGVEIIRRLWTEDRVTHRGRHWQFADASIRPRPLQSRPPILVGAQVEAAIKRAAKIGDGWLLVSTAKPEQLAEQMAIYKSAREAAKLPPAEHICRLYEVACADDEETAYRRVAPYLLEKYASYAAWGLGGVKEDRGGTPEEQLRRLAKDRFAIGAPAQVIEALVAQHRAGITQIAMRVSWPGMGQDAILATIELIGRKVLPEVRRRTAVQSEKTSASWS